MAAELSPPHERQVFPLYPFLALSLVTHLALLAWLGRSRLAFDAPALSAVPIVVDLAEPREEAQPGPPPTQVAKQIVAPSDRENELPPLGPAYLSDRDNRVDKETIRRGNPDAGRPQAKQSQPAKPAHPVARPAPPAAKANRQAPRSAARSAARKAEPAAGRGAPLPGLDRLLPPAGAVLARAGLEQPDEEARHRAEEQNPRRDLTSAPPAAPGLFNGLRGTYDDLPDVAAGQLTMLNTKADRFAPFVRRVGTRVFQNMLIYQRRDLDVPDILSAQEAVTVRATLDKAGKLKSLDVTDHSGSAAMDRTLVEALRQAAFDPNPPSGAANQNGEFEFLFQAQILASLGPGGGNQIRGIESRLRVGLL